MAGVSLGWCQTYSEKEPPLPLLPSPLPPALGLLSTKGSLVSSAEWEASTIGTRGEYGFVGTPFDEHLSVKDDVVADEQPLARKIEQLEGIDRELQRDCLQEVLTRLGIQELRSLTLYTILGLSRNTAVCSHVPWLP
ncbi:unnamed protein product [Sphagnum jensenii]|uniref:Uncharacterized protein n=1 Tax=Sphagnum jensenii TaxID=128206 RepID=A0ABP1ANI2_9BRYO